LKIQEARVRVAGVAQPINRQDAKDAKKTGETILVSFRSSEFLGGLGVLAGDRPDFISSAH
jgi:hypothetical protein